MINIKITKSGGHKEVYELTEEEAEIVVTLMKFLIRERRKFNVK